MSALIATRPVIAAKIAEAEAKQYRPGVLGIRAQPSWSGEDFVHNGVQIIVKACPSTLAVWDALTTRIDGQWLVILTPVDEDQLGSGVLAHLVGGRLRTPDPWDALRSNFAASTLEPALYRVQNDRGFASGLLAVLPPDAYTPAPGGVLTRDHALSAVASGTLQITTDPAVEIDALAVLEWSRRASAAADFTDLAGVGGSELVASFASWLSQRCGRLARPVAALLATGSIAELVPLGIVAGLLDTRLDTSGPGGQRALGAFEGRFGLDGLSIGELRGWYDDAAGLVIGSLKDEERLPVLGAAGRHVRSLGIEELASQSELLQQGLDYRVARLADAIEDALGGSGRGQVEHAWQSVERHFLARGDATYGAFAAAVRLVRWLAIPDEETTGLPRLTRRYIDQDAWVDSALTVAWRGASVSGAVVTLRHVIERTAARRRRRDREFAAALADSPIPAVPVVEGVLRETVLPLAKSRATLLLVLDALSMAVAGELVSEVGGLGWSEAAAAGDSRVGALAVLPTLTQRSRCSLLCGELREGDSRAELTGFVELLREKGLQPGPNVPDPIFHKKALDSVPAGADLATDVANAIADTESRRLVAAVLNHIDDVLHHVDPGGTDWTIGIVRHLRPLLSAARAAGRAVVITSDHGHIIERRDGVKHQRSVVYGQRAHGDLATVADGEVLARGPRVLTDSGAVVLAVDDKIRYGPINAGYHGGGSPAEVVVPVIVLYTGECPKGLTPLGSVQPSWWDAPPARPEPVSAPKARKKVPDELPGLFDAASIVPSLPAEVVATATYRQQKRLAGRIAVDDRQILALLQALLAASSRELTVAAAAAVLRIAPSRINGALLQVKRILDVEGYEVLLLGSSAVRLDEPALREQFGIAR